MTAQQPTAEQVKALLRFATLYGRHWKPDLRRAWCSCIYLGVRDDDRALLQQVRNTLGPSWLVQVTVKQLRRLTGGPQ